MFVVVFWVFINCNERKEALTTSLNLIEKDSMSLILSDIHLTEAKIKLLKKQKSNRLGENDYEMMYKQIFETYHTTRTQFEETMAYYTSKPEILEDIYIKILRKLEEEKLNLEKLKSQSDSIKKN
jgi:hypothetical protein